MIGNQPSQSGLNAQLGQLAINVRNDMQNVLNLFEYVNGSGGATFLQGLGFNSADATAYFNTLNYLQTVAQVFNGTAAQTPAFNFASAVSPAYGGG